MIEERILWGLMTPGEERAAVSEAGEGRRDQLKYQTLEKIGSCSARGEINLLAFVALSYSNMGIILSPSHLQPANI